MSQTKTGNSGTQQTENTAKSSENTAKSSDVSYVLSLTFRLCVTCVIVAGLLGLVNMVTEPRITAAQWEKTVEAMKEVVPGEDGITFEDAMELSEELSTAASAGGAKLKAVYPVMLNGDSAGYAITVVASGSQGTIEMMVGTDAEDTVTGISIIANSETSGIGSRVMKNEATAGGEGVLDQFLGWNVSDGTLTVGSNVDAISGATVSTRGVTTGVNTALAVAAVLD